MASGLFELVRPSFLECLRFRRLLFRLASNTLFEFYRQGGESNVKKLTEINNEVSPEYRVSNVFPVL